MHDVAKWVDLAHKLNFSNHSLQLWLPSKHAHLPRNFYTHSNFITQHWHNWRFDDCSVSSKKKSFIFCTVVKHQ